MPCWKMAMDQWTILSNGDRRSFKQERQPLTHIQTCKLHNSLTPINMHQTQPKLHTYTQTDRQTDIPDKKGSNPSGEFSLLPSAEMILSFD
ncbi:unnamed protein product [Brugia pahangi]|uniref:Ovule protein n=1 Tax=Brugia pahangi TaxID=6280 RepID=A0A0N4SXG2_BRUPA|nr:unnamed protein product [Brugia pahangi]